VVVSVAWDSYEPEWGEPEDQRRVFAWKDGAFRQIDGPTGFIQANADLKLTVVGDLIWPAARQSTATLTLRLENKGPQDTPRMEIVLTMNGLIRVVGEGGDAGVLWQPGLKAGQTREIKLTPTLDPSDSPVDPYVQVFSFITDRTNDNRATIPVVRQ
jgi:hypothetical protein